jgi:hypothetical protein
VSRISSILVSAVKCGKTLVQRVLFRVGRVSGSLLRAGKHYCTYYHIVQLLNAMLPHEAWGRPAQDRQSTTTIAARALHGGYRAIFLPKNYSQHPTPRAMRPCCSRSLECYLVWTLRFTIGCMVLPVELSSMGGGEFTKD